MSNDGEPNSIQSHLNTIKSPAMLLRSEVQVHTSGQNQHRFKSTQATCPHKPRLRKWSRMHFIPFYSRIYIAPLQGNYSEVNYLWFKLSEINNWQETVNFQSWPPYLYKLIQMEKNGNPSRTISRLHPSLEKVIINNKDSHCPSG